MSAFTLIELLVTVSIIAILAALLLPVLSGVKGRGWSVECTSNLRQMGVAARILADDSGGRLPVIGGNPKVDAGPQLRRVFGGLPDRVFRCPADHDGYYQQNESSYDWNSLFNGRLLHRAGSESGASGSSRSQGILFDHEAWHGYRNGVFPDGRAGRMAE